MKNGTPRQHTKIEQISLLEIFRILNRRKKLLLFSIFAMFIVATLYDFIATPIYEASTTIKKEETYDRKSTDQLRNIIAMQTSDEIETEMEIIKTGTVLEKVVRDLNLNFIIQKLELPNNSVKIDRYIFDYEGYRLGAKYGSEALPSFLDMNLTSGYKANKYYIECFGNNVFKIFDLSTNYLIQTANSSPAAEFNLPNAYFKIKWPNAKKGSKLYFEIKNFEKTVQKLQENISLARVGETNIFKINVSSPSPDAAQLIANTIAEEFRKTRLEQKRQTIRYSYNFIDEQLENITKKLKEAESKLHEFKSEHQIVSIDQNSKEAIQFLSNLETEKVKTDLELAEYQNKLESMKKEFDEKGFFDQTYLTPDNNTRSGGTPFSGLLEQLSNAELERLELLQRRTESHPEVIAINDKIAKIKEKLSNYNQNTITAYQIRINALQNKKSNLMTLMKKYSSIIRELPGSETKLAELMRQRNVFDKISTLLLDKREEMRMAELSQLQDFVIIDPAQKPLLPVSPHKKLNLSIGIFLGLFIGIVVVFAEELFGKKVKSIEEIEEQYKIPLLTIVPRYDKNLRKAIQGGSTKEDYLVNLMEDQHGYRESYNLLRTKLMYFIPKSKKTIMITSCEENAGKTSVTANLAISLARMNKKVLIIDCDLKKSEMGSYFGINGKNGHFTISGLGEFLEKRTEPVLYQPFISSSDQGLKIDLLPGGIFRENSTELLASPKMKDLIREKKRSYDFILIDTPPITRTVDTFVLGGFIKDIILVIRPNHTFRENILWAIQEFEREGINILGVVANACELSKSTYKHRYDYGYGEEYRYGYGKKHLHA